MPFLTGIRAELVRALLSKHSGTPSDFSRILKRSYGPVYFELKRLEELGLVTPWRVGSSRHFELNSKHPLVSPLKALLTYQRPQIRKPQRPKAKSNVESILMTALVQSHRAPNLTLSLPILLFQVADRLNWDKIRHEARNQREEAALGFALDVTYRLSGQSRFRNLAQSLRDRRRKRMSYFHEGLSPMEQVLARKNTSRQARRWRWWINCPEKAFRSHWKRKRRRARKRVS